MTEDKYMNEETHLRHDRANIILGEIAFQLKRIADVMEKQDKNENDD